MSTRPVIAVDVDEVLANNAKGFTDFSNQRWGTTLVPTDYTEDWVKMWQIDGAEADMRAETFFKSNAMLYYDHDPTALEVLQKLRQSYDLIIVTARRLETKGDTLLWIRERFPGIFIDDKIFFAGFWDKTKVDSTAAHAKNKGELLKELGADYLIDDQLKHCIGAGEQGIPAVLFGNYPWNKADALPSSVTRVDGWSEVLEYFNARA